MIFLIVEFKNVLNPCFDKVLKFMKLELLFLGCVSFSKAHNISGMVLLTVVADMLGPELRLALLELLA